MRNLKRALSLAVASVMLMGMMVVGTSAASYSDVDASDNLEAIEVLKAVGVMTGADGKFNPDAGVTRNEIAVILTNLFNLKVGGTTPFTDVPAWAAPYVGAVYNNGITAGVSATAYGGDSVLKTEDAALMIMKALGYFGYAGEFGDDYVKAVVAQATKIDLFDGMNLYVGEAMTRNNVAKLALNALESDVVIVTEHGGLSVEGNGISVNQKPSYTVEKVEDKADHNYDGENDGTLQLTEKLFGSDLKKNGKATDTFGRPAVEWTYKADSVKAAKAPTAVYTTSVDQDDVYEALGLKKEAVAAYYLNGKAQTAITIDEDSSSDVAGTGNGVVTEIYVDSDKEVEAIVQYNYFLATVDADYDEDDDEIDITADDFTATLSGEDFAITEYEEDDYVLVTAKFDGTDYDVKSIQPAVVKENLKVTEYKVDDYVIAGGDKYEFAASYTGATYELNKGYDLVLDKYGYVVDSSAYTTENTLADYVFVKEVGTSAFDCIAKVMFMDGTTKTVVVDKFGGSALEAWGADVTNKFYTFDTDKDGNYELSTVADQAYTTKAVDDSVALISGYIANSATKYIADGKLYEGVKNAPTTAEGTVYYLFDDAELLMVYTAESGKNLADADDLVYVLSASYAAGQDADENDYYVYDVVMGGKKTSLKTVDTVYGVGLYVIDEYEDGYAKLSSDVDDDESFTATDGAYSKEVLTLASGKNYFVAEDAVIITIDGTTVKTIKASEIEKNVEKGFDAATVIVDADDATLATVIFLVK